MTEPALIAQLRTQLVACASWSPSTTGDIYYPKLVDLIGANKPAAVLSDASRSPTSYAEGAAPIQGGQLEVMIYTDDDIETTEALARALMTELMSQAAGIPFRSGECTLCNDPSVSKISGSDSICAINISLSWGLSP